MKFLCIQTNPKKFTCEEVVLTPPKGLTATLITGGVRLDWDDNGKAYQVYGSLDGIIYSLLAGIHIGTHTYNHYIPGGLTMYYKVRAFDATHYSNFSNVASIYVTDVDAVNIFARMTTAGEPPSGATQTDIETKILALKAANLYEKHDCLWKSSMPGVASAKFNIVNQYNAITYSTKLTGNFDEICFYSICELSNGDLLSGAGVSTGHIYRSVDRGANWTDEGQLGGIATGSYDICDVGNGVVVAGAICTVGGDTLQGHIFRSTNYGLTWTDLGQQFGHHYIPLIRKSDAGVLIATTEKSPTPLYTNMLRSTDNGLTWVETGNGGANEMTVINMLQYCGGTIWIAGGGKDTGAGVFVDARMIRSTNDGLTWTDLGLNIGGVAFQDRFFGSAYMGNGIILAGTTPHAYILRSIDYGATWADDVHFSTIGQKLVSKILNLGQGKALVGCACVPANGLTLWTDDYGLTWTNAGILSADQNISDIKLLSDGNVIIGTTTDGVLAGKIIKSINIPFARSATNTYDLIKAGAGVLTFVANSGFKTDLTTYLKTNFIPYNAKKYRLHNSCFWIKLGGTLKLSGYEGHGVQNVTGTKITNLGNNYNAGTGSAYMDSSNSDCVALTAIGYNCVARNAFATFKKYVNANNYNLTGNSNDCTDLEAYLLCYNEGGAPNYFAGIDTILEDAGFGKFLTQAEFLTLQSIMG